MSPAWWLVILGALMGALDAASGDLEEEDEDE